VPRGGQSGHARLTARSSGGDALAGLLHNQSYLLPQDSGAAEGADLFAGQPGWTGHAKRIMDSISTVVAFTIGPFPDHESAKVVCLGPLEFLHQGLSIAS
jgi:hypothetical protein